MAIAADVIPISAEPARAEELALDGRVWADQTRRRQADAERLGRSLLRQLGLSGPQISLLERNERFRRAIALWGAEFPLNIEWYDRKIPEQQRVFNISRALSIVLGVGTLAGTTLLVLLERGVTTSQLGVLAAGIFGVMQVLAAGSDPKAKLGGFRKARADLKESMFTFQENWQGRAIALEGSDPQAPLPSPDFMTALYQEIRTGRKIAREERDTFFGTFKSATEILGVAGSALDAVRTRRPELASAGKDAGTAETSHDAAVATRIQDLRNKLADATAFREALEDKQRRLTERKADAKQLDDVQTKIEEAETDRFKVQKLLDLAVKSDVAHPI